MFKFHRERQKYFNWQYLTARDYIVPFIEQSHALHDGHRVLEIGCAEGGVLKAFRERGCDCCGIELSLTRFQKAKELHEAIDLPGRVSFIHKNVYDIDPQKDFEDLFDVILLKDVIEHIPDQERFIPILRKFLRPGGVVFFGFPPWRMPFGGHQQIADTKILAVMPYYHLLPKPLYKGILKGLGETDKRIGELEEIVDTRISIRRFEKIVKASGFKIAERQFWLLNPIYKHKFGKGPVKQNGVIGSIPYFRDFVTTAAYYLIAVD